MTLKPAQKKKYTNLKHLNKDIKDILELIANTKEFSKELLEYLITKYKQEIDTKYIPQILNFAFIKQNNNKYSMHLLMQEHIATYQEPNLKANIQNSILTYYENSFKNLELKDFKDLNLEEIDYNFKEVFYHKEQLSSIEEVASWLNGYFGLFYDAELYDTLEPSYTKTVTLLEKNSINNVIAGTTYNNLGELYRAQGEYQRAEEYYLKALKIYQEVLKPNHLYIAATYDNLVGLYNYLGEYEKAEKYYLKNLKIREEKLEFSHPSIAITYNGLAVLYYRKEEYEKAEEYYLKALKIKEEVLGLNHPDTATTYNNLGVLYFNTGKLKEAKEYLQKALKIFKAKLPSGHQNIVNIEMSLGMIEMQEMGIDINELMESMIAQMKEDGIDIDELIKQLKD